MPTLQHVRRVSGVMLLACLWMSPIITCVHAQQNSIPIQYGETLTGTITESAACQYYRFEGAQGDSITLDMTRTSGSLDGVMALYWQDDFTQAPLINNDDRPGGGLDPLIDYTLPETTWYTVAACRLQADQMRVTTGDYTLTLIGPGTAAQVSSGSPPAIQEAVPTALPSLSDAILGSAVTSTSTPAPALAGGLVGRPELITAGSVVEGELATDAAVVSYRLSVTAGESVMIEWVRTGGDVAPRLQVTDASGRVLAQTATPDAVSALSLVLLVPDDGALTIAIMRFGATVDDPVPDGTAGAFTLAVNVDPAS